MKNFTVTLTFTEPLLGTAPLNKELYTDYVASKATGEVLDEIETVPEILEKATTGFHRNENDQPVIYDYVIKGFFKDAAGMLRRVAGTKSKGLANYKKVIDGLIFVYPRMIPIINSGEITILERPLRAQTAQGERIALSRSEMIQAGAEILFTVMILDDNLEPLIHEWFDYGNLRGLGQWRNASYGRMTAKVEPQ